MSERQAQVQQAQNEVLLELGQALTADRAVLQELLVSGDRGPRAAGAGGLIHVPKMGEADDAEAFLETFRGVAEVSGWPRQEWAHRLLPLLTGEAQLAAHSLPAGAQRDYEAVERAIRDRLGLTPEEHRRRFRALPFAEGDRPFTYAQQLRDQARRWLGPERNNPEEIVEQVALERFIEGLPARTSTWVRYHRPENLQAAVNIAEGHLVPPPTDRRPPVPTPSPRTGAAALRGYKPTPLPRARWRGGPSQEQTHESPSPPFPQAGDQTAREGCWRCGRPGHIRRDCPMMDVGQVVRVAGPPTPPYGPGEAYRIPVRIQRGTYQALLDSGCMQTMIQQRLVRSEALVEASSVSVRCIHGDVHTYPLVPIEIHYGGKTHRVKAAVSPGLTYPLILGSRRDTGSAEHSRQQKAESLATPFGETDNPFTWTFDLFVVQV
ncbi:SCAN domain-containing protein 3 [Merluccius polli]|uniref:SCAN domain-containing protein 3 n=1 Tax=Merluccius polli TaxID=89951 RepID=A0AA47MML2_MERPO|nr:SCAN domain-containing protein 3 [Merluccius polli]